jgi:glycosyltransferase involved in cell wall biosynthesis/polysaccharide pyruvyl transferase WcaK-like protein
MSTTSPPSWVGPENDYRGIAQLPTTGELSIAVVIPVFNRAESLVRTLAGLAAQTHDEFAVVVVDDGSSEDIGAALEQAELPLSPQLLRQERDGFGAHRARNLGAAATEADVVLFVDADCIPHPDLVARHLFWHERASNVVVAGTRTHLDASDLDLETIRSGSLTTSEIGGHAIAPEDWRRLFYRRNKQLTMGDSAFRAGVSSNLSMPKAAFEEVGGFSTAFQGWGGEDTELSWRLWNSGMFIVPDNHAVIYHQTQTDPLGEEGRDDARRRSVALVGDLVPHRFYRKVPSPFHTIPKVSWIARTDSLDETNRLWRELSQASFPDTEILLLGPGGAVDHLESTAANSSRLTLIDNAAGVGAAVGASRGELVAFVDGRARIDRRLLDRAVARLERDPRTGAARCSYRLPDNRQYRRLDDILRIDLDQGRDGFPFFGVVRRRELLKDRSLLGDTAALWTTTLARCRVEHLINDHASIELSAMSAPRLPRGADLLAAGPREVAKAGMRAGRSLRHSAPTPAQTTQRERSTGKIRINYVGFTGRDNLGDEAVLAGVRRLLPEAEIARDQSDAEVLMVGGGTLINGKGYYLTRVLRNDSPDLERVLFGTGVRSPSFWGTTENMAEWVSFIDSALYAGVRGPDSVGYLEELGYKGKMDIFGDPALALTPPVGTEEVSGRIVVCPVHTGGDLWGKDDGVVFARLADTVRKLRSAGHEIVMMSAFPSDDRWLIEIMRAADATNAIYVPGYANLEATMGWLASADLVIGERLHASILAAACETPFVALEYRPKIRDFAKSIGLGRQVLRTDEMDRLDDLVADSLADLDQIRRDLATAVASIRKHQEDVAADLTGRLTGLLR